MDGVAVIRELLVGNGPMIGLVPADQIVGGVLPADTPLDAIAISCISSVDRNVPAPGESRHVTERVQITAFGETYPRMKAVRLAAKKACADFIGSAAGLTNVTVHTAGIGPDFLDEQASIHMSTQDFIVGFTETR